MTTHTKIAAVVLGAFAILGAFAFFGMTPFGNQIIQTSSTLGNTASPAGTTLSSAKIAEQVVSVTSSTTFSMLNSDATDRTITAADIFLTGGNSTSTIYTITCATSTSLVQGLGGNTNNVLAVTIPAITANSLYGTTTNPGAYLASSSPGILGTSTPMGGQLIQLQNTFARTWKTGSYLNCVVGTSVGAVNGLLDSAITGYISFPYRGQ